MDSHPGEGHRQSLIQGRNNGFPPLKRQPTIIDTPPLTRQLAIIDTDLTQWFSTLEKATDHDKIFTLGVFLGDVQIALGTGPSKQEAEQKAAEKALEVKGW